jgi:hypothetical protein
MRHTPTREHGIEPFLLTFCTDGRTRTYDYCFVRAEPLPLDDARLFDATHEIKVSMLHHLGRSLVSLSLYPVSDLNRCSQGLKVLYPRPLD